MSNYKGQNYKVNRKIKEAVDRNQINYRESENDPITVIKRVNIYITDKKGNILKNVLITMDNTTIQTGNNGLLISNFPNKATKITVEKEGYKTATADIILNAEIQTHNFYLALSSSDEESEVVSIDNTSSTNSGLTNGQILFEPALDGTDAITCWSGPCSTEDGVFKGRGAFLTEGWSNEGLWQLDCDVAYSSSRKKYVGIMPICSEEINPYTDEKLEDYAIVAWEGWARGYGLDAYITGPNNYKYISPEEYHHLTIKKIADDTLKYIFDGQEWTLTTDKLQNLETLHVGIRDNPYDRSWGDSVLYKNIKVVELTSKADIYSLNKTVELNQYYSFTSYADDKGATEWGSGKVKIISIPSDNEAYIGVSVIENEPDASFIGQTFYVQKNAEVGNKIYPLYTDKNETEAHIYVSITAKVEQEQAPAQEQTPSQEQTPAQEQTPSQEQNSAPE